MIEHIANGKWEPGRKLNSSAKEVVFTILGKHLTITTENGKVVALDTTSLTNAQKDAVLVALTSAGLV